MLPDDLVKQLREKATQSKRLEHKGFKALFQYEDKKWWTKITNRAGFTEYGAVGPKKNYVDAVRAFKNWVERRLNE